MNHDEIRAALAAATPGPWAWLYPDQCCRGGYCIKSEADLDTDDGVTHAVEALHADVVLIANTPTWLAELLAEVDRLTSAVQEYADTLAYHECESVRAEQAVERVREFAEQGREFADRTMDDAAAHWARSAADGIIRALDGR